MAQVGQTIRPPALTWDAAGQAVTPDTGPTAVLYRNGSVVAAASVTLTPIATGKYSGEVLLDAAHGWVVGDSYAVWISWTKDTKAYTYCIAAGMIRAVSAVAGDAMALTSTERTTLYAGIWSAAGRTLTGWGSLVSDIWAAVVDSPGVAALLVRLSPGRAGYLDNLSGGAVALQTTAQAALTAAQTAATEASAAEDSATLAATRASEAGTIVTGIEADYMRRTDPVDVAIGEDTVTALATETAALVGDGLVDAIERSGGMLASIDARLTGFSVEVRSPLTEAGELPLYRGFDYLSEDNMAPRLKITGAPNLDGSIVTLEKANGAVFSTGSVITAGTGIEQILQFAFTRTQTTALVSAGETRRHPLKLRAKLSNGHEIYTMSVTVVAIG